MANKLPDISRNFAEWYTKVILEAKLADYGPVRGTMILRPNGYALWKNVQKYLGAMIEDMGVQDAYFPLFIPMSYLKRESEHVEGFAPEVAVVTHAGGKKLEEPLVVRPTSETIMYEAFSRWIKSYRDLPLLINQWNNVVRWEKRTVFFLRTSEFLWQEGHTAHATRDEAVEMVFKALNAYDSFLKEYAAIWGVKGYKTHGEKFAGAEFTTTIEVLLRSKKALQSCTSHFLAQKFAKPFDVKFLDENNMEKYVWQTSWGMSTRVLGAIVGVHGDQQGLILPPKMVATQVVIVPIFKTAKEQRDILEFASLVHTMLKGAGIRVALDASDKTPGWKFNHWELLGTPLRIEIGQKELETNTITVVDRVSKERRKLMKSKDLPQVINELLSQFHEQLLKRSRTYLEENTYEAQNEQELAEIVMEKGGFIKVWFKDSDKTAAYLQDKYKVTPRVIPLETYDQTGVDFITGEKGARLTLFAKAY